MSAISVTEVHSFLSQFYHPAIVDLAAEFPTHRPLTIDWNDLNSYNERWTEQLQTTPQAVIETLETALASYPLIPPHGQLSFEAQETKPDDPPFVRIENYPSESDLDELPQLAGMFARTAGRVTAITNPESRVATAVFECEGCRNTVTKTFVEGDSEAPTYCDACDTSGSYRFNGQSSTFVDAQFVTLGPMNYCDSPKITVELRHDLLDSVALNSKVSVTGTVFCTGLSERSPTITILANNLKTVNKGVPHPAVEYATKYLDVDSKTTDEFGEELDAFATQSARIVDNQLLTEEDAQAKIITPFIHLLGWNVYSEQVKLEYTISGVGGQSDYMLLDDSGEPRLPVEAKAPGKDLDEHAHQIERYMRNFDCDIGLLTTGNEYRLYGHSSDLDFNLLFSLQVAELPANESLLRLLREDVVSNTESVLDVFSE